LLAIVAKSVIFLISIALCVTAFVPLNFVAAYSVLRPLLQPFALLQYSVFGYPISVPVTIIVIFVGLVNLIIRKEWVFNIRLCVFFSGFVFIACLSTIYSVDIKSSIRALAKLLTSWVIFNMAYNSIRKSEDAGFLLKALVASSIIPLIIGFYQVLTGDYDFLRDVRIDRLSSLFGVANAYGIFLSVIMVATGVLLLELRNRKSRVILGFIIAAAVVSQILALNRGTWIALSCAFLVAGFKYRKRVNFRWVVVLAVVITVFFSGFIVDRFSELENNKRVIYRNTFEQRVDYWKAILPLIERKPISGYGLGTSEIVTQKYLRQSTEPHNDYVKLALEVGIIGSLFYLIFLLRIIFYFLFRPVESRLWHFNFGILILSTYFLIISTTQNIIYNLVNFPAFLILVAIGIKTNIYEQSVDGSQLPEPIVPKLVLPLWSGSTESVVSKDMEGR